MNGHEFHRYSQPLLINTIDELVGFIRSFQVLCEGQVIGAIIAETQVQAQNAAKAVKVTYEELPAIVTIEVID